MERANLAQSLLHTLLGYHTEKQDVGCTIQRRSGIFRLGEHERSDQQYDAADHEQHVRAGIAEKNLVHFRYPFPFSKLNPVQ